MIAESSYRTFRLTYPLLLCLALAAAPAAAEKEVERVLTANSDVEISLECLSGQIHFIGWDKNEVRISGSIADGTELEVSGESDEIDIEISLPDWSGRRRHVDVHARLEIQVPREARLEVETLSAPVEVDSVSGTAEISSMSGNVRIGGALRDVEVETVSGRIEVEGVKTQAEVSTVNGNVTLRGVGGRVQVASVSGNVEVTAGEVQRAEFETVSASVSFTGRLSRGGRLEAQSYSGNITLTLPDVDASFEIETLSGNIENELGPEAERSSRHAPGMRLTFETGSGDARVTVETLSGRIQLRR